jgi:hypothetical protein
VGGAAGLSPGCKVAGACSCVLPSSLVNVKNVWGYTHLGSKGPTVATAACGVEVFSG